MIVIRLSRVELRFEFSFFVVLAVFSFLDQSGYGLMSLLACACHEMGHIIAMLCKKKKIDGLVFYGGGIRIKRTAFWDGFFIISAGSGINFILFFFFYFTADHTSLFPLLFAIINLIVGIFNLLPIGRLDGKKLLEMFLIRFFNNKKIETILKITENFCFISVLIITVLLLLNGLLNPTLLAAIVYIAILDLISEHR